MKNTLPIESIKKELSKYEWTDDNFGIAFDYENVDGHEIHLFCGIKELWIDWWTKCNLVPENGAICHNIDIMLKDKSIHYYFDNDEIDAICYSFENLMGDLAYCLTLETIEFDRTGY